MPNLQQRSLLRLGSKLQGGGAFRNLTFLPQQQQESLAEPNGSNFSVPYFSQCLPSERLQNVLHPLLASSFHPGTSTHVAGLAAASSSAAGSQEATHFTMKCSALEIFAALHFIGMEL